MRIRSLPGKSSVDTILNLLRQAGYAISFFSDYSPRSDAAYPIECE